MKDDTKKDRSLDTLFSWLWEIFKVFWKESEYIIESIEVKDDLKRGVRNVQKGQEGDSQRIEVLSVEKTCLCRSSS